VFALVPYPEGGSLSWHHLWFVAYLYLYCLLAIPLFVGLGSRPGRRALAWLERAWARGWVGVLFVPLALERIALRGYPETHTLVHDPDTFAYYGLLFVLGHLLGRSQAVWAHLVARRWRYLAVTCALLGVMLPPNEYPFPLEQLGAIATVWSVVLTAFAWARWYYQRPGARLAAWLEHAQQLSYPFYLLHQTVILVVGWAWMQVALGPWPRFAAVLVSSFAVTWLLCEAVARVGLVRPLFGLAPRRLVSRAAARVG
jgi:surface polysaccharide O-acyltransferase-like enzyme